jgi:hypothetical protein
MRVEHGSAIGTLRDVHENQLPQAHQQNNSLLDITTQMTSGSWLGPASQIYAQTWQQIHEDVHSLINQAQMYAENGLNGVNSQVNFQQDL